ncbi:four helix bundle protein [Lewinella sp. IMCC34191]|uniref:four helix bundle protein n=1 Tax=Lewinella sp. IMCC34191 TaxID=2259172 RepID=UPI000E288AB3|nr:four helix bundle protein [Lewinella sp. IMCC34191]
MSTSHFTTWLAFQKSRRLAASIYNLCKTFPPAEKYALTDQVLRSSRSVCANLAECYAKRRYPKHFIAKLTDCAGENHETEVWLMFARDHGYISRGHHTSYQAACEEVSRLLSYMQRNPEKFVGKAEKAKRKA